MSQRETAELFVIGALESQDHDAVQDRIDAPVTEEDADLARHVADVRDRFHALDMTATELPVEADGWDRIAAAIASGAQRSVPPPPLEDPSPVSRWRAVALAAIAASVVLAGVLGWQVAMPTKPAVVAVLLDDGGDAVAMIEAFADDSVRVTALRPIAAEAARVFQIWTKPDPDGPPVSLGILDQVIRRSIAGPDLPDPAANQLYEITIEPAGGSPTGLPTGPVVGKGLAKPAY